MPLNRLNVRNIDYPNTKDAIAMVSKLEYVEKYDRALRYYLYLYLMIFLVKKTSKTSQIFKRWI